MSNIKAQEIFSKIIQKIPKDNLLSKDTNSFLTELQNETNDPNIMATCLLSFSELNYIDIIRHKINSDMKEAFKCLQNIVKMVTSLGLNRDTTEEIENEIFQKLDETNISLLLGYYKRPLHSIIRFNFHPTLPLVLLKYSKNFFGMSTDPKKKEKNPWTFPLRLCRGIVIETKEPFNIVSFPYKKFFNISIDNKIPEHDESTNKNIPWDESYEIHNKYDGFLIQVFTYDYKWRVTSSGSFQSKYSNIAKELLKQNEFNPNDKYTYIFELLLPDDKILIDYKITEPALVLHGIRDENLKLIDHNTMNKMFSKIFPKECLNIKCKEKIEITKEELFNEIKDKKFKNKEGYVIYFPKNELMIKAKCYGYLNLHRFRKKLTWKNVVYSIISDNNGRYSDIFKKLPKELIPIKDKMTDKVLILKKDLEILFDILINRINGITYPFYFLPGTFDNKISREILERMKVMIKRHVKDGRKFNKRNLNGIVKIFLKHYATKMDKSSTIFPQLEDDK